MNDNSRLNEAEWNKPYRKDTDAKLKLSKEAFEFLVEENDFSLMWHHKKVYEERKFDADDLVKNYHKKRHKIHKEIECFLEQVEIKEKES